MSIVDRIVAEGRYHRRLKVLQNELKPARERGKVGCCKSGFCCWQRPCELAPEDVPRIAAHLEVTPQALFEDWLVVDELANGLALLPRRRGQQGGRYLSADETWDISSPCVFLTSENLCEIHPVKPAGGRAFECWNPSTYTTHTPGTTWKSEDLKALGWDGVTEEAYEWDGVAY